MQARLEQDGDAYRVVVDPGDGSEAATFTGEDRMEALLQAWHHLLDQGYAQEDADTILGQAFDTGGDAGS